jgi:hypothetical protein
MSHRSTTLEARFSLLAPRSPTASKPLKLPPPCTRDTYKEKQKNEHKGSRLGAVSMACLMLWQSNVLGSRNVRTVLGIHGAMPREQA